MNYFEITSLKMAKNKLNKLKSKDTPSKSLVLKTIKHDSTRKVDYYG